MKTAMQKLIEWANNRVIMRSMISPHEILEQIEPLLEKEEEQIKDACNYGCRYGYSTDGQEYYNQT